ncbi:MAG: hypothetical protein QHH04_08165 [Methanolinea sp.]|jgi:hypothetical protein|nr:hypothetical protein [Methanolinea sp.]
MEDSMDTLRSLEGGDEGFMEWQEEDLAARLPEVMQARKESGLDGLVGDLEAVVINTERERLESAVTELLAFTGLAIDEHFSTPLARAYTLRTPSSPAVIVQCRLAGENPFLRFNQAERAKNFPNTRLETFIFGCRDIDAYCEIQRERGVRFQADEIITGPDFRFIQTVPSPHTGNSLGFIEWTGQGRSFAPAGAERRPITLEKPWFSYLENIGKLDHTATRVRAKDRNAAILEFLSLTNYHYDFAVFVKSLNSITSVARLNDDAFAMVFTSGIAPYSEGKDPGPTENFIHWYGTRVHHMAFSTDGIDAVFAELGVHGMEFLVPLVGSREEGLKQTFSMPSPHTMIVNEYIHRYEGFDGFFTRSNVEALTRATGRQ